LNFYLTILKDAYFHKDDKLEDQEDYSFCHCCHIRTEELSRKATKIIEKVGRDWVTNSISHDGVEYKVNDFVYINPELRTSPYVISQITEIKVLLDRSKTWVDFDITLQLLRRCGELGGTYTEEIANGVTYRNRDKFRLCSCDKRTVGRKTSGNSFIANLGSS
jgi:hypothetical protein